MSRQHIITLSIGSKRSHTVHMPCTEVALHPTVEMLKLHSLGRHLDGGGYLLPLGIIRISHWQHLSGSGTSVASHAVGLHGAEVLQSNNRRAAEERRRIPPEPNTLKEPWTVH